MGQGKSKDKRPQTGHELQSPEKCRTEVERLRMSSHVDAAKQVESQGTCPITQAQGNGHEEVKSKLESTECQTFRTHFGQLLNAITDPDTLAANLYAKHFLSIDTLKEIKAEGTHTKSLTLLLAVQDQISVSPATKFRDFVLVLHSDPSLQHLACRLDPKLKSDTNTPGCSRLSTPKTLQLQFGTTRLTGRDHSVLCEYLNKHAAHWRTIGQYLGFLPGELDNVQHIPTLIVGGPVAYLSEMLAKWLQWAPGDGRGSEEFATLEALKHALNKADFGVTATELTKSRLPVLLNFSSSGYQQHIVESRNDDTSIMHQLHETTSWVIGKTMKEFQASIESKSLSAYDKYASYLRDYYTRNKQSDDKWPHLGARKYIRLAVVSGNLQSRKDLDWFREAIIHGSIDDDLKDLDWFRKSTIHGSIDDILEAKAPLELHEIFSNSFSYRWYKSQDKKNVFFISHKIHHIKQVLIEGAPGIGKSTLSWEICERWARGELFTYFSMVLLLKFRDKWVQDAKCLSDLFGVHYRDHEIQCRITHEIESTQGSGLLLILEGYDEAPASLQISESIFLDLFTGKLLPNATVVITTRPSASFELRYMCQRDKSRRIEVLGFGTTEINEYILTSFSEHVKLLPDFKQYLDLYPHIHSMMYVPLNSAIVTRVYQESKSTSSIVPKTMTQLYSSLIRTLLLRYLKEQPEYKRMIIRDFADLKKIPTINDQFLRLCEIAYSGITKAQTELIISDLPSDFNTLGLMQSCPQLYIDEGESYSYNFLHLTIQEFLAAYHISLFDEQKFESEIEKLVGKPVVTQFLVGLCHSKSHFRKTAPKLIPVSSDGTVSMSTLHLLFEAHDLSAFDLFEHGICYCIESSMKPFDCYVLGSCISSSASTCTWEIDFSKCNEKDYKLFVKGLNARTSHVKSAIVLKHITDDSLCSLFSALEPTLGLTFEHLKIIHFVNQIKPHMESAPWSPIPNWNTKQFANFHWIKELLTNYTLKYLALNYGRIRYVHDFGMKENSAFELSHDRVKSVSVIQCLAETLETNSTLEHLDCSNSAIGNEGAFLLAKTLEMNSTLKYLNLSHNGIENKGAFCLAKALETNSTLEHLDLSNNVIQGRGATCLAKALETNSTLKCLNLSHNLIGNLWLRYKP